MLLTYVSGKPPSKPKGTCPLMKQVVLLSVQPEILKTFLSKRASMILTFTPLGKVNVASVSASTGAEAITSMSASATTRRIVMRTDLAGHRTVEQTTSGHHLRLFAA